MDAPRVALIADRFWNVEGGTERQLLLLTRALAAAGVHLRVVFLRAEGEFPDLAPGIPVETLDVTRMASLRTWRTVWGLMARLSSEGIGLCHTFFNDSSIMIPPLARAFGLKVVISRRDLGFWHTPLTRALARINGRLFVNAVVANCEAVRVSVIRDERINAKNIHVIHNAVPDRLRAVGRSEARQSFGLSDRDSVLTVVANLRPMKRIDSAIDAIARLKPEYENVVLLVVGEDVELADGESSRAMLERRAAELGVGRNIRFLGRVADPSAAISAADVCLSCSESEGLSNSIIEYMSLRRPVICTEVGGNAELVEDGRSGYLFPVGDAGALAARLRDVLGNPGLAETFGQHAAAFVERLTPTCLAEKHVLLYRSLLESRPASDTSERRRG